jgi:hypothetical protein
MRNGVQSPSLRAIATSRDKIFWCNRIQAAFGDSVASDVNTLVIEPAANPEPAV